MINVQNADVYTDFNGLAKLKNDAKEQSPEALQQVAKQFESLFLNMVLKSMREAKLDDGVLDNDQSKFYQDMYDKQLAVNLSGDPGIGLADLMVKQLGPKDAKPSEADAASGATRSMDHVVYAKRSTVVQNRVYPLLPSHPVNHAAQIEGADLDDVDLSESKQDFVTQLLPMAQQAADELGVDPKILIAQAALETGWGNSVLKNRDGSSSHNLFNIKSGQSWDGKQTRVASLEYEDGVAKKIVSGFRAYDSFADSFNDYVKFIKEKPRYADALQQVSNPARYMQELQQAGYATDPNYAGKVMHIYNSKAFTDSKPVPALAMR